MGTNLWFTVYVFLNRVSWKRVRFQGRIHLYSQFCYNIQYGERKCYGMHINSKFTGQVDNTRCNHSIINDAVIVALRQNFCQTVHK